MQRSSLGTESASRWKYVYCVMLSKMPHTFGAIGIERRAVYTVHFKDLAAVVSDSAEKEYEVMEYGVIHQKVAETVTRSFAVVPMAFGQVATEEDVKAFLSQKYYELREALEYLAGKVELGLKVTLKQETALREVATSSKKVKALKEEIARKDTYWKRVELGRAVSEELAERGRKMSSEIYGRLAPLAVDSKINEPLRTEMILNAAFLVDSSKEGEFDRAVDAVEEKFGGEVSLRYVVSPPYDFVHLEIGG
ncbi:MAG: GvpL/GvpF family gas vesicle protein [Thaumarchaeota archaeon]|nr:GvpL/GvpF family gas vesicle protein [Nitrososphaerota archaeon]